MRPRAAYLRVCLYLILFIATAFRLTAQDIEPTKDQRPFIFGGLAWSLDGTILAVGTSEGVYLHRANDLSVITQLNEQPFVTALDWNPNGVTVASGNFGGVIELWDARSREKIGTLEGHEHVITSVKWSPDGTMIASGSVDDTIRIWNAKAMTQSLQIDIEPGYSVYYSPTWKPDGNLLASQTSTGNSIWDINTGEQRLLWSIHREIYVVKWSLDGKTIASGGGDIRLWDAVSGKLLATFEADGIVFALAWSPDSKRLASLQRGDSDMENWEVVVWNMDTGEIVAELPDIIATGSAFYANALEWSPDGSRLASTSDDGRVFIWDAQTFTVVAEYSDYLSLSDVG